MQCRWRFWYLYINLVGTPQWAFINALLLRIPFALARLSCLPDGTHIMLSYSYVYEDMLSTCHTDRIWLTFQSNYLYSQL